MNAKPLFIYLNRLLFNRWMLSAILLLVGFIFISNLAIVQSTKNDIYSTIDEIPKKSVGLVLGTSRYTVGGYANLFFKYRISAAADLYHSGKIMHIIVSGDNRVENYNEPRQMRNALIALAVPKKAITLDFAGFRTLDSVVRTKEVFGQSEITIISQRFHIERALFIASKYNMNAIGFSAQDPPKKYSVKTRIRECFAKTKAVIDLYFINKKPKFLGEKEVIII